jgi:hypothetical protein
MPEPTSLILCDHLDVDPFQGGQMSVVGILHHLSFDQFPTPTRPFTLYCALYGGEGEGTMQLVVSKWSEEQDIYRYERWMAFPYKDEFTTLEIILRKCRFPSPGRYCFQLRFEEELLGRRFFDIREERS